MSATSVLDPPTVSPTALRLRLPTAARLSDEAFFEFCRLNRDLHIERTAEGDVLIMTPAGGSTSRRNVKLVVRLEMWSELDGTGQVFDSSGGFILPDGAIFSPDVAWVQTERLAGLTAEQKERFLPLCPDFVMELRSPSDALPVLRAKMEQYVANGARLGWLIDPQARQVHVYHGDGHVETLDQPDTVSGDPVLPGFTLALPPIWEPL